MLSADRLFLLPLLSCNTGYAQSRNIRSLRRQNYLSIRAGRVNTLCPIKLSHVGALKHLDLSRSAATSRTRCPLCLEMHATDPNKYVVTDALAVSCSFDTRGIIDIHLTARGMDGCIYSRNALEISPLVPEIATE